MVFNKTTIVFLGFAIFLGEIIAEESKCSHYNVLHRILLRHTN